MTKVLVVCAHADDEVLGAGGAIARHVADGAEVWAMYFTTGLRSRPGVTDADITRRKKHAWNAAELLGFKWYGDYDYPDNRMDSVDLLDVVQDVEKAIDDLQPALVYTHHGGDLNIDHNVVWRAVMTATRPLPEQIVREVRLMEVPSSTEFSLTPFEPNLWVPLTPQQLFAKMQALDCYVDEVRDGAHPRSLGAISNLAVRRGHESGYQFAEAFNVVRRRV